MKDSGARLRIQSFMNDPETLDNRYFGIIERPTQAIVV